MKLHTLFACLVWRLRWSQRPCLSPLLRFARLLLQPKRDNVNAGRSRSRAIVASAGLGLANGIVANMPRRSCRRQRLIAADQ